MSHTLFLFIIGVCDTLLQKMTQQFNISGMTCEACEYKIQHVFSQIPSVKSVVAKFSDNSVVIETETELSNDKIIETLKPHTKYAFISSPIVRDVITENKSWTSQYYPLFANCRNDFIGEFFDIFSRRNLRNGAFSSKNVLA